ncbi:hypothetical protein ACQY0O_000342 [Thecaphora frezii]
MHWGVARCGKKYPCEKVPPWLTLSKICTRMLASDRSFPVLVAVAVAVPFLSLCASWFPLFSPAEAKVALAALSQQPASLPHLNEGRITREWDKLQRLQRDADTRALLPHSFSVKGMQTLTCTLTHQASSDFGPAVRAMRPLHMAVERGRELMAASQPQSPASRNHGRPIFNSAASASASSSASALAPAASTASAPARSRTPATTAQLPLATSPSPWTTKTIPDAFQADPRPNARSHAQAQAAVPGNHLNYGNNNRPSSAALDPAVMAARHQGPASTNLGAPLDGTSIVPHALASQGPTLPSSEASLFSDALTTSAQKANLVYTPSLSATDACDNGTVASPAAQTSETVVRPRQGSPYIVPVSPSSQRDTLTSDFHSDPSSNVLSRDTSSSSPHNFGVPGASTGPVRSSYLQQTLEAQTEAPQTTADPGLATARGPRSDDIAKNAAGLLRRGKTWSPVPTNEGFPLLVGMSTLISARLQRKQGKAEGGRSHSSDRSRPGSSSSPPVASRDTSMSGSFKSGFASPQIDDWSDGFTGLVDLDRKMRQLAMDESRRHVVGAQAEAWSPSASDRHLAAVPKSRQSPNDFSSPKLTGFTKQLRHRFSDRQQHRDRAGRRDRGNATSRSPPRRDSASSLPSHAEASGHGVLDMALSSGSSSARTLPLLSESAEAPHRRTAPHSALRCDSPSVMSPFGSIRLRYAGEASTQAALSYNSAGSPGFVDEEGDDVEPLTPMPMPRPNYHEDVLTPNSAAAATWTDPDAPGYFPAGLVEKEKKEKRHAGLAQIAGSFSSSSLRERSKPRRQRTADGIYHQTNDGASQVTGLCSRAPRHSQGASNASSTNASSSPTFSTRRLAHDPSRVGRVRSCSEASSLFSHSGAPSKFTSVSSVTALQEGLGEQAEQAYINAEAAGSLPAFYSDLEARSRPETHHRASSKSESLRRSAQSLALGVRFKMLRAKRKIRQSGNAFVNAEKRNEVADGNPALIDTLPLRP